MVLKRERAWHSLEGLLNTLLGPHPGSLTQSAWGEAHEFAFLISSQEMLLGQDHTKNHCSTDNAPSHCLCLVQLGYPQLRSGTRQVMKGPGR